MPFCSRIIRITGPALAILVAIYAANIQAAKLYKWVDESGVVHYSDKMPPELSKVAHEELDKRGLAVREVEREKTEDERMAEQVEQSMQAQQRRIEAEKLARQRMRDQILLQTFTTERDLLITRDDRLNAIDSIISLTANNNKRTVSQIEEVKGKIARTESSGREVPENLAKTLENLNEQFEKNKSFIELKQKERKEVSDGFTADLNRFRELKGIESGSDNISALKKSEDAPDIKLPEPENVDDQNED
ncbi:MAG: DUF4124 domain-containing protein [Gammaproteobacteria bacterium]|nr:DUF4124 domain-containing protein [Gammaproteobacteria bacterium]